MDIHRLRTQASALHSQLFPRAALGLTGTGLAAAGGGTGGAHGIRPYDQAAVGM